MVSKPFIHVLDPSEQVYIGNAVGSTYKITAFKYQYKEEEDDEFRLTIQSRATNLPDLKMFFEDSQVILHWGYIGGASNKRLVTIRSLDARYLRDGISYVIQGTDLGSYLKVDNALAKNKKLQAANTVLNAFNDLAAGNFKYLWEFRTTREKVDITRVKKPAAYGENLNIIMAQDNVVNDEYLQIQLDTGLNLDSNKSTFELLVEQAGGLPEGPWVVEARDNVVAVRRQEFSKNYIRYYKYGETRELLDFIPGFDTKKAMAQISSMEGITLDAKTSSVDVNSAASIPAGTDWNKQVVSQLTEQALTIVKQKAQGFDPTKPNNDPTNGQDVNASHVVKDIHYVDYSPTDEIGLIEVSGTTIAARSTTSTPEQHMIFSADVALAMTFSNDDDREAMKNQLKNDLLKGVRSANEATAVIIGDPKLEVNQMIYITGTAQRFSGRYYIKSSSHSITETGGYTTNLELILHPLEVEYRGIKVEKEFEATWQTIFDTIDKRFSEDNDDLRINPKPYAVTADNHDSVIPLKGDDEYLNGEYVSWWSFEDRIKFANEVVKKDSTLSEKEKQTISKQVTETREPWGR